MLTELNAMLLRIFRRWWIVVIVTVLAVALIGGVVLSRPTQYQATTLAAVAPASNLSGNNLFQATTLATTATSVSTVSDLLSSPKVIDMARRAALIPSGQNDAYSVTITAEPSSSVLRIVATGPDSGVAQKLAAAIPAAGNQVLANTYPLYTLAPLAADSSALPSAKLVSLPVVQYVVLAIVVGLLFGCLVAFWVDSFVVYQRSTAPGI